MATQEKSGKSFYCNKYIFKQILSQNMFLPFALALDIYTWGYIKLCQVYVGDCFIQAHFA